MTTRPVPLGAEAPADPLADPLSEAEDARARRLAREAREIEEAREDVRAGRVFTGAAVDDLLDRFVRGEPLPEVPPPPPAD